MGFYERKETILKFVNSWKLKKSVLKLWNKILKKPNNVTEENVDLPAIPSQINNNMNKFHDTKNFIIGNGHVVVLVIMGFITLLPTTKVREMTNNNFVIILTDNGKMWYHISKISNSVFHYLILPILMILFNPGLRKSIYRNFLMSINRNPTL